MNELNNVSVITDESMDSIMRPHGQFLTAHKTTYATIVLLQERERQPDDKPVPDFLGGSRFDDYISTLTPDPEVPQTIENKTLRSGGYVTADSLDGTNTYYGIFNNFSLQSVQEQSSQIVKIHQNFSGYWNAFFFGESPRVFSFSGVFIDTREYPYYQEFMVAYDKWLAGNKCVENNIVMKIIYDGRIVDGYMISISTTNTADQQYLKQFQFTVLVRASAWLRSNIIRTKRSSNPGSELAVVEAFNGLSNVGRFSGNVLDEIFPLSEIDKRNQARVPDTSGGGKVPD